MPLDSTRFRTLPARRYALVVSAVLVLLGLILPGSAAFAQNPGAEKSATDTAEKSVPVTGEPPTDPNQPLQPDFLINVTVVGESEPSGNYRVDQAGNVGIRYANIETPIPVKGLTPDKARDVIARFLHTYIKDPQVTVKLVSVPRPVVWVTGAVRTQGQISVPTGTTLLDVLSRADWTENADLSQLRLTRREIVNGKEKFTVRIIPFDKYVTADAKSTPDESLNVLLQNRDRIFLPLKNLPNTATISVQGDVAKPAGNIPLRLNPATTIREAISLAGGTIPGANLKSVSVRRMDMDRPLIIDLQRANEGDLINNIDLKPNDAIFVEHLREDAFVNLNGGFVKPGKLIYGREMTLTQAVNEGGGPAPGAKLNSGVIFRNMGSDPKDTKVIGFNWNDIQKAKAKDIALMPGDTVFLTPGVITPKPDFFTMMSALSGTLFFLGNFVR